MCFIIKKLLHSYWLSLDNTMFSVCWGMILATHRASIIDSLKMETRGGQEAQFLCGRTDMKRWPQYTSTYIKKSHLLLDFYRYLFYELIHMVICLKFTPFLQRYYPIMFIPLWLFCEFLSSSAKWNGKESPFFPEKTITPNFVQQEEFWVRF